MSNISINTSFGIIPDGFVEKARITFDLYSMFATGKLVVNDMTKSYFNKIKTGLSVDITLNGNLIPMRILSFDKVPSNNAVDVISADLISDWYFDSVISNVAYQGKISEIYTRIFGAFFKKINKLDISASDDYSRIRYQLGENTANFMQRIMKYGIKGNLPMYLYTDTAGYIKYKGINEFLSEKPLTLVTPYLSERLDSVPASLKSLPTILLSNYKLISEGINMNSNTTTIFTTANFKTIAQAASGISLVNAEAQNDQSEVYTPTLQKFTNWNLTPDDALAISVKEDFEKSVSSYYLQGIAEGFHTSSLNIGKKVQLILPYEPVQSRKAGSTINLGEGEYIVKKVEFLIADQIEKTRVQLIQATTH